nr:hypothetical protein [Pedobacter panaciterrae]
MKKINTLYAVILSRRPDLKWSTNKVIGIRFDDGQIVTDDDEIGAIFPEKGEIITFQTFHGKNEALLNVDDLVEIPVKDIKPIEAEGQLISVNHEPMLKRICYEVIEIPFELFSDSCFRLEEVDKELIGKKFRFGSAELYLSIASQIFGPFKLVNGKMEPKLGKDVTIFKFNPETMMTYRGENYLLERPKNEIGRADCMSSGQLMDWVKDKIKEYGNYNGDINNIIKLLKRTESFDSNLDRTRFARALSILENIELSIDDIGKLFSKTSTWHEVFRECFEKNEMAFRNEHLLNLEKEFEQVNAHHAERSAEMDKSITMKEVRIAEKYNQLDDLERLIDEKSNELSAIDQRRDELILNIKLQANIAGVPPPSLLKKAEQLQNYEMRDLKNSSQFHFETIDDYLDELKGRWGYTAEKRRLFESSLTIILQKRFLLASNTNFILALIQSLGNSRVCLQQAEVDWIKFGNLFPKGLEQIIESAETNPALSHYFILQDFNLPSFECYGKPLVDLADGIRVMVPGTDRLWPINLFVVLIPVAIRDADFGFKINQETFQNWGVLPYTTETSFGSNNFLTARIELEAFASSMDPTDQGSIEDYIN